MLKNLSQVSHIDDNMKHEISNNLIVNQSQKSLMLGTEKFTRISNDNDNDNDNNQIEYRDILPMIKMQKKISNDDPLNNYLDGISLYSKIVKDKILIKLDGALNFRNLTNLLMDIAQSKVVRSLNYNLFISNNKGNLIKKIEQIQKNCSSEEIIVKNKELIYIILPVLLNSKDNYILKWTVVINGYEYDLMTRYVSI
jgi:hypothetical protein